MRNRAREYLSQQIYRSAGFGRREQIGGRTLQHGHLRGLLGQRRDQRHRRGAAADDHHLLALVVEILGPVLWMNYRAVELVEAREVRGVALVVVVVAGPEEEEAAAVGLFGPVLLGGDGPGVVPGVPVRRADVGAEPDVLIDAVLVRGGVQVLPDVLAVGPPFRAGPRLPWEAQREDAAVRAHPRVAEQVPGAADLLASLQDDIAGPGIALGDAVSRAQAREARADDDDINVCRFGWRHGHRCTSLHGGCCLRHQIRHRPVDWARGYR